MNAAANGDRTSSPAQTRAWSRRRFLRGLGVCIALPSFESFYMPLRAQAAEMASGTSITAAPIRMAFVTFPNGAHQGNWWPTGDGNDFQLGPTMESLSQIKNQIQIIAGLDHKNAMPGSDGAGDHARASATLLTGCRAKKTSGDDIHVGVSIDQLAAQHIGHLTRFASIELTCDAVRSTGGCEGDYSCAYQYNIAWKSDSSPMPPEPNPRLAFERLFGGNVAADRQKNYAQRKESRRSVLDFVLEDTRVLRQELGRQDHRKLDEYLTSIREVELRIESAEKYVRMIDPETAPPAGIPSTFEKHMGLMYDILLLAFRTDSTRIATLMLSSDGNNRVYPDLGISDGHHYLSHHQGDDAKLEKIGRIDRHYMRHFAEFLQKLSKTEDTDGSSLLENSMIVYCCGNADGNRHTHINLPVLVAGSAGGRLKTGRYLKLASQPMCNLYVDMLDCLGIEEVTQFGDSNGQRVFC
jgi:Protein of unknown function (DUF1552)